MAGKPRVTLDLAKLAAKAKDTGEKLRQPRGVAEYVPSPLAALIKDSYDSETAREIPLDTPGEAPWFIETDDKGNERMRADATPTRAEYNAIVAILRKDAKVLGLGVRVKEITELLDDDTEHLVAVEFQGRPQRAPAQTETE